MVAFLFYHKKTGTRLGACWWLAH